MGNDFWREDFGQMLDGTHAVPFGDLTKLEKLLKERTVAAVVLEPIQAEAGIILPPAGYLASAQRLCLKYGTLFVLDEVQTGIGRTGRFLAAERYDVQPDMIVLANALSGGLVPIGAGLGMGLAAGLCGMGQGRAVASATEALARNPGTRAGIMLFLVLGLAFIESLTLFTLVIVFAKM
jgi:acetylornithine/succinyldiaminopimelate/putrescine aminotransferase